MSVRITINKACDRCGKPFLLLQLKPGEVPVESDVVALKIVVKGVAVADYTDICNDCAPVVDSLIVKLCLDPASSLSKIGQGMVKPAKPAPAPTPPAGPAQPVEATVAALAPAAPSLAAPAVEAAVSGPAKPDGRTKAGRAAKAAAAASLAAPAPAILAASEILPSPPVVPQAISEIIAPAPVLPKPKIVMIDEPSPVADASEKNGVADAIVHPF